MTFGMIDWNQHHVIVNDDRWGHWYLQGISFNAVHWTNTLDGARFMSLPKAQTELREVLARNYPGARIAAVNFEKTGGAR